MESFAFGATRRDKVQDSSILPGFEDSRGIEIRHTVFESYHACGAVDASGKAARLPMLQAISHRNASIYNYHECYLWSLANASNPTVRTRDGVWAASGSYIHLALSDGLDSMRGAHPVLDTRKKDYRPVKGTTSCRVFWARDWDGTNVPRILSRSHWCRCEGCRSTEGECWHPDLLGNWAVHRTDIKEVFSVDATMAKKAAAKLKRKADSARKADAMKQASASSTDTTFIPDTDMEGPVDDTAAAEYFLANADYETSDAESESGL